MGSLFFGGSAIAAVIAGAVSLFAPCCISVMLPAFFSTAFQNRRVLVAMTFLFAAGIATIILPLAVGAAFIERLVVSQHTFVYTTGGMLLLALGAYTLMGGRLHLPMPGRRASGKTGPLSVYTLGAFSGVATSCCAPVLAGVVALSGAAGTFAAAVGLGLAYVFGMVAPLFVLSLLWERMDWRSSRLFAPRTLTWRVGSVRRSISASALASGLLLVAIGLATAAVGIFSGAMASSRGWQAALSAELQHLGAQLTRALSFLPSWAAAVALGVIAALLARHAMRQITTRPPAHRAAPSPPPPDSRPSGSQPDPLSQAAEV